MSQVTQSGLAYLGYGVAQQLKIAELYLPLQNKVICGVLGITMTNTLPLRRNFPAIIGMALFKVILHQGGLGVPVTIRMQ